MEPAMRRTVLIAGLAALLVLPAAAVAAARRLMARIDEAVVQVMRP